MPGPRNEPTRGPTAVSAPFAPMVNVHTPACVGLDTGWLATLVTYSRPPEIDSPSGVRGASTGEPETGVSVPDELYRNPNTLFVPEHAIYRNRPSGVNTMRVPPPPTSIAGNGCPSPPLDRIGKVTKESGSGSSGKPWLTNRNLPSRLTITLRASGKPVGTAFPISIGTP